MHVPATRDHGARKLTHEVHAKNVVPQGPAGIDARVRISIRDYGHGIPPEILPHIFDPYFSTKPGGRGLGLATAYAIIAKHGGCLSVESEPGRGIVVTIDLPASQQESPAEPSVAKDIQTGAGRILIMDDEEDLRVLLKSVLTRLGYDVQTARDGAEAITLYEKAKVSGHCFDVVVLDLTVNCGMGGIKAAAKLKAVDPAAKLIVSTGYSDAPVMADYRKYGSDKAIPKPWNLAEVSEVLKRVFLPNPARKVN